MRSWSSRALLICLLLLPVAGWAQSRVDQLNPAAAVSATDTFPICQGCSSSTTLKAGTALQLQTFMFSNAYTVQGTPTFSAPAFTSQTLADGGRLLIGGEGSTENPNSGVGSESTCLGDKACNTTTGSFITAVGHNAVGAAGANPFTGSNIVCVGTDCMRDPSTNTSTGSDVGMGVAALRDWGTNFSVAIGTNAMRGTADGSATGDGNVAVGYQALGTTAAGVTAFNNVVLGANSTGVATTLSNMVIAGANTGSAATTAQKGVWLGAGSGAAAIGMFESVLAGYNSGHVLTGNSNTFVGDETGLLATTANNNTVIGHKVGSSTLSSGSNILLIGTGTGTDSNTSNSIHIGAGGSDILTVTGTGTNTTSVPTLHGTAQMPDLGSSSASTTGTVCWTTGTGLLNVDTTTTCLLSTMKVKHDIEPLSTRTALAEVNLLKPVSFAYNDQKNIPGRQVGLIAEDVAEVDPRLVRYVDGDPVAVKYQEAVGLLVGAIQEQQAEMNRLAGLFIVLFVGTAAISLRRRRTRN